MNITLGIFPDRQTVQLWLFKVSFAIEKKVIWFPVLKSHALVCAIEYEFLVLTKQNHR